MNHLRLKELRLSKGFTQTDMAHICGVSKSSYVKYERGERQPRYDILSEIADYFKVSLDYLLGKSNEKNVHMSLFRASVNRINDDLFKEFGNLSESVKGLVAKHTASLNIVSELSEVDLLYMMNSIQEDLWQIYFSGLSLFLEDYGDSEDVNLTIEIYMRQNISEMLAKFNNNIKTLRERIDKYIAVLSDPVFYNSKKPYFETDIKKYSMSKFEKEMNDNE